VNDTEEPNDRPRSRVTQAVVAVERLAAFTAVPTGGNPAGVVLDGAAIAASPDAMLTVAAAVGYSETVFVTDGPVAAGRREYCVRYFSPKAEVPFCGHATIALGVAMARLIGPGRIRLTTASGPVSVDVAESHDGHSRATLISPPPSHEALPADQLEALLACFGWTRDVLDPTMRPAVAYAGARHAVVPLRDRATLAAAAYDFDRLRDLSIRHEWVTLELAWAETPTLHHIRAPFPYGGLVEDAATGAGAAAYAGYLRDSGWLAAPAELTIRQGVDMGRPSTIFVAFDGTGPISVTGHAIPLDDVVFLAPRLSS
jgi:PhzF family phenazine biosynthesis protein